MFTCRFMLKWYYSRQFCCLLGWLGCMHIFLWVMQTILKLKLAGPKSDCGHQKNYDVTKASMKYSYYLYNRQEAYMKYYFEAGIMYSRVCNGLETSILWADLSRKIFYDFLHIFYRLWNQPMSEINLTITHQPPLIQKNKMIL